MYKICSKTYVNVEMLEVSCHAHWIMLRQNKSFKVFNKSEDTG